MATPYVATQNVEWVATDATPGFIVFEVKDAAGADIDVSTGYTFRIRVRPAIQDNRLATALYLEGSANVTITGGNGTITVTWKDNMTQEIPQLLSNYSILMSDDSFTTRSTPAYGQLGINETANY